MAPAMQVAAADVADLTTAPEADAPPPAGVTVTTETVTTTVTRTSYQEFDTAPVRIGTDKKSHLSDLEKVGLVALGALVIGAMINDNRQQVVSNTGDRVIVRQYDGSYVVYKDDNALLREPGSTVTTQTFRDGSTRVIVERADGSQITTIRDASGRVLQRVAYDNKGRATILIDDMQPEIWVDVRDLPRPRPNRTMIELEDQNAALRAAMASADIEDLGRKFSLRQIRTIPQVRDLAPTITMNTITFASGSAAVEPSEAARLNKLGKLITDLIAENPNEVFLIEGHTDAVGSAASNLALSDRRAESVAKALTEYFDVPPENLVVQGYGESELLVPTGSDERANRRVAVRIITALLQQTAR
jgi:outer membrane protein OmpA-like peptidoglycan-associated protein